MTDEELRTLHDDRDALVEALQDAGATFRGNAIRCPFHDDKNPSGQIYEKSQVWRFKCHSCGIVADVLDVRAHVQGCTPADLLKGDRPAPTQHRRPSKPQLPPKVFPTIDAMVAAVQHVVATYKYTTPNTNVVELIVIRCEPPGGGKRFLQGRPEPTGGFTMKAPAAPLPIYNRSRIQTTTATVVIVEGEQCVHALAALGYVATTSPGGAGNGAKADWSPLAGKTVILWPDWDDADAHGIRKGVAHMEAVAGLLAKLDPPPTVSLFNPEPYDLPAGGDVVDFLALYGGDIDLTKRQAIDLALEDAEQVGGASGLARVLEDKIAGRLRCIPLPWRALNSLTQALLPGTVTCVCGEAGSSKSLWVVQALCEWQRQGVKACAYELEDDLELHLGRALAQLDNNSGLTEADYVRANPDTARAAYARHKDFLNRLAGSIDVSPDTPVTLANVAEWVAARAKAGYEVIVVDPITAAEAGDKRFLEDMRLIVRLKSIARQHKCSMILMTHPKPGSKGWTDLAGGACYVRFSHSVLWIHRYEPARQVLGETYLASNKVREVVEVNRSIKIGKARNGAGAGLEIGFEFDPRSLRFFERGTVVKTNATEVPERVEDPFANSDAA